MLEKEKLERLYLVEHRSSHEIATIIKCSVHKVDYWLNKHNISKRTISDAIYSLHNPDGDPFVVRKISNQKEAVLFGLGLGLYWGEGNKKNKSSIRLGNTDPRLIAKFIDFLVQVYGIKKHKLRFALQIFSDMKADKALKYWQDYLNFPSSQFLKVVITPARSIGTYREKSKYGVLTVHFHNKKLRNILINTIENLQV